MLSRHAHWVGVFIQLSLSGLAFLYIFRKFGHAQLLSDLGNVSYATLAAVGIIQVMQIMIGAWRTRMLIEKLDEIACLFFSVRITFVGYFFSQTAFSFIGGDGMRLWQMLHNGYSLRVAGHVVMSDRILGSVMLLAIILLGLPFSLGLASGTPRVTIGLISVISAACCAIFFFLYLLPLGWQKVKLIASINEQASFCRNLLSRAPCVIFAMFAVPHLLNVIIIYIFLADYGGAINLLTALVLVPPVLLLAMLPISVAGWGIREGALVAVLGSLGIEAHVVVAASIAFGLSHLLVSLPGAVLWGSDSRMPKTPVLSAG